jgi:hypothetical protein
MKEYNVHIQRTYNTTITLKFPDDGRDHKKIITEQRSEYNEDILDLIAEKELEQMDIIDETWRIEEINNNTITGALSPDTGPRN